MSNLLNQVTPLTRGIIWLTENERNVLNPYYKEIDYLLDGLLTASLKTKDDATSRVIIGKNFDKLFFVIVLKKIISSEFQSFLALFQNDLLSENDVIVIDELDEFDNLKPLIKGISPHLRKL